MPIGEWNDFKTYAWRSGFWVKKGEKKLGRKTTHLLLDGGILEVPPEKEQEFLDAYARSLLNGADLYVVEMKSEPCFFFMSEFDIKMADRLMNAEELQLFIRVVQSVMSKAFPSTDVNVGVSTAPAKNAKTKDGRECIQSGIHLNWRIPVDLPTAWILRAWIIRELDVAMPTAQYGILEPWYEGYDPCVLLDNGLRMIGSKKAEACPDCNGRSSYKRGKKTTPTGPSHSRQDVTSDELGSICATCQSVGRIDKGRPYTLFMVAGADGNPISEAMDYYTNPANVSDFVKFLSIRCPSGNPEYAEPTPITYADAETEKRLIEAARLDKQNSKKSNKPQKKAASAEAGGETSSSAKRQEKRDELHDIGPDDPIYDAVSKYIISEFRGAPIVSRIKRTGAGDCYIVNSRCHFCENKVRTSSSSYS
jgi:hypothetical protein